MTTSLTVTASLLIAAFALTGALFHTVRRRKAVWQLQRSARRYARGDFSTPPSVDGPGELNELADALTQMAAQLDSRLSTVVAQRNELGAVLSSMAEGVVTVDSDENILSLNAAATRMLGLTPDKAIGQPLQTKIRNHALAAAIRDTLATQSPVQQEITLHAADPTHETVEQTDRHIQIQTALLRDDSGGTFHHGVIVVLHDVTQVRRLESMRRDFVANVSHEIKTPIAAIKAAVENLADDLQDTHPTNTRFLNIINRQADRMTALIDDLLSLARIEQGQEALSHQLERGPLQHVVRAAMETCQANAQAKAIRVDSHCPPELQAWIQPALLEQALVNLIDNAIKYSPERTRVRVRALVQPHEIVLEVNDQGRGIEPAHLPRIFERFYRTDKARSRQLGGTGLGLSIVKHVAEAHGGRVSVDSTAASLSHTEAAQSGSTFRIHLPQRQSLDP